MNKKQNNWSQGNKNKITGVRETKTKTKTAPSTHKNLFPKPQSLSNTSSFNSEKFQPHRKVEIVQYHFTLHLNLPICYHGAVSLYVVFF
jgi:hypothetical protein